MVEYSYIDDDAHPGCTSDGPLSSSLVGRIRENILDVHTQRRHKCGWMTRDENPWRVCSIYPVSWPVALIQVDPSDPPDTIRVLIRGKASWSKDDSSPPSGGDPAIKLAATVARVGGGGITWAPPRDDDWVTLNDDDTTAANIELTAQCHDRTGVLVVLLWTYSVGFQEDTGTSPIACVVSSWGGLELVGAYPHAHTDPVERAVLHEVETSKGGYTAHSNMYQIGHYFDNAGDEILFLTPPVSPDGSSVIFGAQQATLYTMGVCEISGCSIEVGESLFRGPGPWCFHTDEPADEDHGRLCASIERLTSQRVPWWMVHPGQLLDGSDTVFMLARTAAKSNQIGSSYVPIASCVIAQPPPAADGNGFTAWVMLGIVAQAMGDRTGRLKLQIRARELQAVADTADNESAIDEPFTRHNAYLPNRIWSPMAQMLWGVDRSPCYQFRGALIDPRFAGWEFWGGGDTISDLQMVQLFTIDLEETDIDPGDYPLRLIIEAKITSGGANDIAVLGASVQSRRI